jgi:uncharacterized protein (DUF58 family)
MFAAALALVVSRQGDAVGTLTFAERPQLALPPAAGRRQLARVHAGLEVTPFGGFTDVAAGIRRAGDLLRTRGMLLVLSDFYDLSDGARRELRRLVRSGHDLSLFHVVSPEEIDPRFTDGVDVEDQETGELRPVTAAENQAYRERFAEFLEETRRTAIREGIDYARLDTSVPLPAQLRRYLLRRAA